MPHGTAAAQEFRCELGFGERVQERIGRLGDVFPERERVSVGRCAHRRAVRVHLVQMRVRDGALREFEPVALLLPRQVAHGPTDAVHGAQVGHGVFGGDAL